ncbi:MAG: hypothetical protein V3U86_03320 [Acidobacteriota bacterium]
MERDKQVRTRSGRELQRMTDRAVPPTDVLLILDITVLSIVDEQIHAGRKVEPRNPVGVLGKLARAKGGLVVRQIGERGGPFADSVPHGRAGMTYEIRRHPEVPNLKAPAGYIVESEAARQVPHTHRKQGR